MKAHISFNNGKTGIPSVSLLAGDKNKVYSGYLTEELRNENKCHGTCSGTCPGCYALKMTRLPDVFNYLRNNTIFANASPVLFIHDIETQLFSNPFKAPKIFRIHDSGDFFSYDYFVAWMDMIKRHPETIFGAYTKEKEFVEKYGIGNLPSNLCLSCSPWKGVSEAIEDLPQFIYDDGTDPEISKLPHCPAVDKNGHKTGIQCIDCLHCYTCKRGAKRAVYAH